MNKLVMGTVENSLEEMINVKYNVPRGIDGQKWYTLDNEFLAPYGTLLENQEHGDYHKISSGERQMESENFTDKSDAAQDDGRDVE